MVSSHQPRRDLRFNATSCSGRIHRSMVSNSFHFGSFSRSKYAMLSSSPGSIWGAIESDEVSRLFNQPGGSSLAGRLACVSQDLGSGLMDALEAVGSLSHSLTLNLFSSPTLLVLLAAMIVSLSSPGNRTSRSFFSAVERSILNTRRFGFGLEPCEPFESERSHAPSPLVEIALAKSSS
jgi:hypothetical protein